jgi:hypothetical protein
MHEFHVDLTNTPKEVGPFEPRSTENLLEYRIFLISNEKVVVHCRSHGRNFMFADRITVESRFILTQTGSSGADLKVHLEARGRIVVKKAIGPLRGIIFKQASYKMAKGTQTIWAGVPAMLAASFRERTVKTERADPTEEARRMLLQMQETHSNEFEQLELELIILQRALISLRRTLLLVLAAFCGLVLIGCSLRNRRFVNKI